MLMLIKSKTEAMRALASVAAVSLDAARVHPDAQAARPAPGVRGSDDPRRQGLVHRELRGAQPRSPIQVHGGMGFIEETGVAQLYRDARITPIYEGTTGIQANDLVGRKIARDGGRAAQALIAEMRSSGRARQGIEPRRRGARVPGCRRCARVRGSIRRLGLRQGLAWRLGRRRAAARALRRGRGRLAAAALRDGGAGTPRRAARRKAH